MRFKILTEDVNIMSDEQVKEITKKRNRLQSV